VRYKKSFRSMKKIEMKGQKQGFATLA